MISNIHMIAAKAAWDYSEIFQLDYDTERDELEERFADTLDELETVLIDAEIDGEELTIEEALARLEETGGGFSAGEWDAVWGHLYAYNPELS